MKKNTFWEGKAIVVTGGAGFLGSHLVEQIKLKNPKSILIPRSKEFDLRKKSDCTRLVKKADIVIHLAATVGGIGCNQNLPGTLFYDNILMGTHLL